MIVKQFLFIVLTIFSIYMVRYVHKVHSIGLEAPILGMGGNIIIIDSACPASNISQTVFNNMWDYPIILCQLWNKFIDSKQNFDIWIKPPNTIPASSCSYNSNDNKLKLPDQVYVTYAIIVLSCVLLILSLVIDILNHLEKFGEFILPLSVSIIILNLALMIMNIYIIGASYGLITTLDIYPKILSDYEQFILILLLCGIILSFFVFSCNTLYTMYKNYIRSKEDVESFLHTTA